MEPDKLAEIAKQHARPDMDAILLSCANVRAFEAVEPLEKALGKPVITSNQAVLWDALQLLEWRGPLPGGGRLFNQERGR